MARQGPAWPGEAWRGQAWHGKARQSIFFNLEREILNDNENATPNNQGGNGKPRNGSSNGNHSGTNADNVRSVSGGQRHPVDPIAKALLGRRWEFDRITLDKLNVVPICEEYRQRAEAPSRFP